MTRAAQAKGIRELRLLVKPHRLDCCGHTQVFEATIKLEGTGVKPLVCSYCEKHHREVRCDEGDPVLVLELPGKASHDELIAAMRKLEEPDRNGDVVRPEFLELVGVSLRTAQMRRSGLEVPGYFEHEARLESEMSRVEKLAVKALLRGSPYRGHRLENTGQHPMLVRFY